ncbi:XdhC family protein [Pelagibacterium montanilacus]|uniref:XdhC family protein n=1 Tax=Pelagibacterium montanilacus TaxID=2185280 RepID=UPI0019D2E499|nr:XdhC family protein [Pelagibacterium montanilacus]
MPALLEFMRAGKSTALVTLVAIDGSSPRPLGSQMAVCEDGTAVGNITGGCAEAAIVAEAVQAMDEGRDRRVRYGEGSPYFDVRLPCGSGIEIYINVSVSRATIEALDTAVVQRAPTTLIQNVSTGETELKPGSADCGFDPEGSLFARPFLPVPRLVVIGRGPVVTSLVHLASGLDWDVRVQSSDEALLDALASTASQRVHLSMPDSFSAEDLDFRTAGVLLFHDHDWEPPILKRLLASECFYVGALGSRRTHARRVEIMSQIGVSAEDIARVRGPVGLDIGAKSPPEIAISILAEIIAAHHGKLADNG